jgi:hypothetical protein
MHDDVSWAVWRGTSQLRRVWRIPVSHAWRQHRDHEISCFYITFSSTEITGIFVMTTFDVLGGGVYTVKRHSSQLRRAWHIDTNHAFTRRRAHEIMSLKVAFHMFVQFLGMYSATNPTQIHGSGKWLWDRVCVWYLWGLESGIGQWLKHFDASWEHKTCESSSPAIIPWIRETPRGGRRIYRSDMWTLYI